MSKDRKPNSWKGLDPAYCIFCGGRPLSREHIYPRWLGKLLDDPVRRHRHFISHNRGLVLPGKMARPGAFHAQQLRVVCKPCNNGWMSQLQEEAKPHLGELALGQWHEPTPAEAKSLSRWATMFTMVNEFADPRTAAIPAAVRRNFMETGAVPDNWLIWMGRYLSGSKHPPSKNHHGAVGLGIHPRSATVFPANFQSTGFTVGQIVFQTVMPMTGARRLDPVQVGRRFGVIPIYPVLLPIFTIRPPLLSYARKAALSNYFAEVLGIKPFYLPANI